MTVKQYLGQIQILNSKIDRKLEELELLKSDALRISPYIQEDRVQTTKENDKIGKKVEKILEKEEQLNELIDSYYDTKEKIIKEIESLDNETYIRVLHSKYVLNYKNEQIAEKMHFSKRYILYLLSIALIEFDKKYYKNYIDL